MQNSIVQSKKGEKEESRTGFTSGGWRNWSRGQIHTLGQLFWVEVKQFGLRLLESEAADLWQSEWNNNHIDNPCCSHIYSGQGHKSPRKCSSWELEHRDWRAIPGQGLLLTAGRQPKGTGGRRSHGKCLWRKAKQTWSQGDTAESHTGDRAMSIAGLSPHIITGQWGPVQRETKTERPQREWPFKCLMHQAAEKDPSQGGPLSAWCAEKQKRPPKWGRVLQVPEVPRNREEPQLELGGSPVNAWMGQAREKA